MNKLIIKKSIKILLVIAATFLLMMGWVQLMNVAFTLAFLAGAIGAIMTVILFALFLKNEYSQILKEINKLENTNKN